MQGIWVKIKNRPKRIITFIDTPGHEAFANMRSHGVSASDIVLLVVASDDGIKPQTKESIEKILASKLPFIVVITKTDAPGAAVDKVKQQLAKEGAAKVLIKPAAHGTGVIAGGSMRAVLESAGITDVLAKSLGSANPHNVVKATVKALASLREPIAVAKTRNISLKKVFNG